MEEGHRFARHGENDFVDVGFRLIEEALDTEESRLRITASGAHDANHTEYVIAALRRRRSMRLRPHSHSEDTARRASTPSDSAPHPYDSKSAAAPNSGCAAGVYTSPVLLPLVAHLLESFGALDRLEGFVSEHGRAFYGRPAQASDGRVTLRRASHKVVGIEGYGAGETHVVPFWAGKDIGWEIVE